MIITRQDPFSFRIQTGETIINFQAEKSTLELKMAPSSDRASPKRLFVETPGEYEMDGITIEGAEGALHDGRIFYTIHLDDMTIGFGGLIANTTYDVLLLLIAQSRNDATKALAESDTRILIPFGPLRQSSSEASEEKMLASFLKELDENSEEMEKLTIKKKDIPPEGERKIVLLKPLKK